MKMTEIQLVELFKSGDFTIIYWDSGEPTVYKKKWDKDEEFNRDQYETLDKFKVEFEGWENGYCPYIVDILAVALGGTTDSI